MVSQTSRIMKTPLIKKLNLPSILHTASSLKGKGKLARSKNNLVYLDIDDAYIHQLFPLLQDPTI